MLASLEDEIFEHPWMWHQIVRVIQHVERLTPAHAPLKKPRLRLTKPPGCHAKTLVHTIQKSSFTDKSDLPID
jgi:hypothetical protein